MLMRIAKTSVLLLMAGVAACDDASPTRPSPDVAGEWAGEYVVVACTPSVDTCSDSCRGVVGRRSAARLTLEQSGSNLSGPLTLPSDSFFVRTGTVSGRVSANDAVSLGGTIPEADRVTGRVSRYLDLSWGAAIVNGNTMSGGFFYTTRLPSGGGCTTSERMLLESFARVR
jgi:hypothetical protein